MNTTGTSPFLAEIERLMEAKGIEDLEELHARFMEQEPERIGNARWTYERFRQHASAAVGQIDARFMVPGVANQPGRGFRAPAFIMPLAALSTLTGAALLLCAPQALRGTLGSATMTTPGGHAL